MDRTEAQAAHSYNFKPGKAGLFNAYDFMLTHVRQIRHSQAMTIKRITATKLREDIYNILDQVSEQGITIEVARKGHTIRIASSKPRSKLARAKRRNSIVGDAEGLVHMDWSSEWSESK